LRAPDDLDDILSPPQRICVSLREVHLVPAQVAEGKWPAGAVWRTTCAAAYDAASGNARIPRTPPSSARACRCRSRTR
jgi:hypothetical protein